MTKQELKDIVQEATGTPCDVEENRVNLEFEARTNCHYLGITDITNIMARAELIRISSEGGQITLYFTL